jgi:hypothetical protein
MNKQQISSIATVFRKISSDVSPVSTFPFQLHDGVAYNISNESAVLFNEQINKILRHSDFASKFSSQHIEKKLKTIFSQLLQSTTVDLENEIEDLISNLSQFRDQTEVFMKIEGLKIDFCFSLGTARFSPGDASLLDYIEFRTWDIVKTTKHTDDEKVAIMNELRVRIKDEFSGDCVAIINVDAEPIRAREIAKEEIGRSIDLMRYASKVLYPIHEDMRLGLKGDYPKSRRQIYAVSETSFNPGQDLIGSIRAFRIDEKALKKMEEIGIFIISEALEKKNVTNYEDKLIRGVHWFSVSLTQVETSNAFLFLIVALESLFSPNSGQSIAGTVSESVAFLLSDNLEGRKQLINFVRKSYSKRSKVAHGGNKEVSDNDYYTLLSIVGQVLMICIKKNPDFQSQKELMNYIEEIKLS